MQVEKLTALLPAAGAASRFGHKPKVLARLNGLTLLEQSIEQLRLITRHIVVVTGCYAQEVAAVVPADCQVVHNPDWKQGLGCSIASAMPGVRTEGLLITLPDQPKLRASHFAALASAWLTDTNTIVCAGYAGTVGVPAILPRRLYPELQALQGDRGAASLLRQDPAVEVIPMPAAAIDIDYVSDLKPMDRERS